MTIERGAARAQPPEQDREGPSQWDASDSPQPILYPRLGSRD